MGSYNPLMGTAENGSIEPISTDAATRTNGRFADTANRTTTDLKFNLREVRARCQEGGC